MHLKVINNCLYLRLKQSEYKGLKKLDTLENYCLFLIIPGKP